MRRALSVALVAFACAGPKVPWSRPRAPLPSTHAEVQTLNAGYRRLEARALVRQVQRPTRANLDWAAYHANVMIADAAPEPDEQQAANAGSAQVGTPFGGTLTALTGTITTTPLTPAERAQPLALAALVEFINGKSAAAASGLSEVIEAVRSERWGLAGAPHLSRQGAVALFVHGTELWIKVEFQPWFRALGQLPDEDADGVPEIYGRVRPDLVSPEALRLIREDYASRVLSAAEIKAWANQLSSYWYPSYNTDLVAAGETWPDASTEAPVVASLAGGTFPRPAVVLRGKPHGEPVYNVFIVEGLARAAVERTATAPAPTRGRATPDPRPVAEAIARELAAHGSSWSAWAAQLAPFHATVKERLRATPAKVNALAGTDGFLFFRKALAYVLSGDLAQQPEGKNPVPAITAFARTLNERGIDFLFVPVPNKIELFPDKLDAKHAALAGQVVAPWARKLIADLAAAGVEVVDLWPPFLAERSRDTSAREPLYQPQDTHWTHRGLDLAARTLAERIRRYPWYAELAKQPVAYTTKEIPFTRHGDLHARLASALQRRYKPETLTGVQVLGPGGTPYQDDPASPIVVLGDSFTGVYQLTDCEHAGLSAHLARGLGFPVDLVMSYGGGPNVRQKLLRRGEADLLRKRLVIWVMTARDLHDYWGDWEILDFTAKTTTPPP